MLDTGAASILAVPVSLPILAARLTLARIEMAGCTLHEIEQEFRSRR